MQLKNDIKWYHAMTWRNQFFALGLFQEKVHIVHGNWKGHFEYHSLGPLETGQGHYMLAGDERYSNRIFLHSYQKKGFAKTFNESHHFDNETILSDTPDWFPKGLLGFCQNGIKGMTTLSSENNTTTISHFTMEGALIKSYDCKQENKKDQPFFIPLAYTHGRLRDFILRNDHYYFSVDNFLYRISENGMVEELQAMSYIRKITASNHHLALRIALITDDGCLLLQSGLGAMKMNEHVFAADLEAFDIKYIPDNCLVVAGENRAEVYDIQSEIPVKRCIIETDYEIVAILETGNRNHCALLLGNGKISTHYIGKQI